EQLCQLFNRDGPQQSGVNGGDTVRAMRAYDGQVGHANFALVAFLNEAGVGDASRVPWEPCADNLEQTLIDFIDDLEVPRQKSFEPTDRPFLECFGEERMVGVSQCFFGQMPGLVPTEVGFVK